MKAITIPQPLADLFAEGTLWALSSSTVTHERGPILIHAGTTSDLLRPSDLRSYPTGSLIALADLTLCVAWDLVKRQALRTDRVAECLPGCGRNWGEIRQEPHHDGKPFVWVLENVRRLEHPIPCAGHAGLWEIEHLGLGLTA